MGRPVALALALVLAPVLALADMPKEAGVSYAVSGRWVESLDYLKGGQDAPRSDRYFRALALLETGRITEAYKELKELAQQKGSFSGAAVEKVAEYAFGMGRFAEIVSFPVDTAQTKLGDPDSYNYRLGQSYFMVGDFAKAKPILKEVKGGKWKPYARHSLTIIEYSEGNTQEAIERSSEALEAASTHPDRSIRKALVDNMRLLRGRLIYQASITSPDLAQDKKTTLLKVAISQLSLIDEKSALYADALRSIGWCAVEMGDSARAIASFQLAMGTQPEKQDEDLWSMGKVFERLGYFEEASQQYGEARLAAMEQADVVEANAKGDIKVPNEEWAKGWGKLILKLDNVAGYAADVTDKVALAQAGAHLKTARLDEIGSKMDGLGTRIDALGDELSLMDADLYHYLDVIPASSLFPKKDRPRIESLLSKQDYLVSNIKTTEDLILAIQATSTWDEARPEKIKAFETLWGRMMKLKSGLSDAQLTYLESLKKRVAIREKELVRMVESRKQESAELKEPLKDARRILAEERAKIADIEKKMVELVSRAEKAVSDMAQLREKALSAMKEDYRKDLMQTAVDLRIKADQYALDETQALQLMHQGE